ncbi:MAG: hypothetical protein KKH28_11555 [Elusimicrobia bacterium]|nr:hypothetical protein [Elusimicrobiota bacterium]
MCRNADTYSEQDVPGELPYFHVRVLSGTAGVPPVDFIEDGKPTIKCCKGNVIDPAALQACISTQAWSQ